MDVDRPLEDLIKQQRSAKGEQRRGRDGTSKGQSRGAKTQNSSPKTGNKISTVASRSSNQVFQKRGRGGNSNRNRTSRPNLDDKWEHNAYNPDEEDQERPKVRDASLGSKIRVSNLKFDVLEDDLNDLFGEVGTVHKVRVNYDKSGRSSGTAEIIFFKESDAERSHREFDGRQIDGQTMHIEKLGLVNIGPKQPRASQNDEPIRKQNNTRERVQNNNNNNNNNNSNGRQQRRNNFNDDSDMQTEVPNFRINVNFT